MSRHTKMSSGTSCRGRAAGQGTTPFERALHQVYDRARGVSNAGASWVRNPRTGERCGRLVCEHGITIFERQAVEKLHKYHNKDAWALEVELLTRVERLGATWYRLATDCGRVLCVPLKLFREHGESLSYKHGLQLALRECYFSDCVSDDDPFDLLISCGGFQRVPPSEGKPHACGFAGDSPEQRDLFGGEL